MAARTGTEHHKAKLTNEQVIEIRRLRNEEGLSIMKIAERVGWIVETQTIDAIVRNRTWRHLL